MLSRSEWWDLLSPSVAAEGLEVFDIDVPNGPKGVLRITIQRPGGPTEPVDIEDCAKVSRRISALDRFDDLIPDAVTLEVSSPGIERKLRRVEHFVGAIGERVRLKRFDSSNGRTKTVRGKLTEASDSQIVLELADGERDMIPLGDIQEGQVEFEFRTPSVKSDGKKQKKSKKKK